MTTADETDGDEAPRHDHLVEDQRRLSRSLLWSLQRSYYDRRGVDAWATNEVPWFVTSNACLARAYAQVIDAFLRDVAAGAYGAEHADPARPVHVIEVGAGHGRLGFLVLEQLVALAAARADLGPRAPLRYVMTDVVEANLAFCAAHPALRPHLDAGRLDLAHFDGEGDGVLRLRGSGAVLSPDAPGGPVVALANYVFDSLRHDAFRVDGGRLDESLAALCSTQPEPDLDDPGVLERVRLVYAHVPAAEPCYDDPALDAILAGYRRTLTDTVVCIPVGALACVRNLHRLAGGRLLLLSADKGFVHEEELLRRSAPQPVVHGSFSLTVNYHAIAAWFGQVGGHALDVTPRESTVAITAFLAGAPLAALARTRAAFAEHVEAFGPMDFMLLQDELRAADRTPALAGMLAILRLGDWDPWLFYRLVDRMLPLLDDASEALERDTRRALVRVWARYYHLGGVQDVPFELGRVWARLRNHGEAIAFYRRSLELFGDSHVTHHNIGLCLYSGAQRYDDALVEFDRALALAPDYGPARTWKLRVQAELRGG